MEKWHLSGKKRWFRAGIAVLLTLSLCFLSIPASPYFTVRAATMAETKANLSKLQEELKNLQKNSATARSEYESALADYNNAQLDYELAKKAKIELDEEIYALETEIEKTKELLDIYTEQRVVYENAIVEKEEESEELFRKFLERVRINYEDSFTSYLEMVLSSDSFADLLYRVDVVASLLEYDKRVMKQLDQAKVSLEGLQADYQQLQIDTQEAYDSLKAQIPILEQKQIDAEQLIRDLNLKLEEAMAKKGRIGRNEGAVRRCGRRKAAGRTDRTGGAGKEDPRSRRSGKSAPPCRICRRNARLAGRYFLRDDLLLFLRPVQSAVRLSGIPQRHR